MALNMKKEVNEYKEARDAFLKAFKVSSNTKEENTSSNRKIQLLIENNKNSNIIALELLDSNDKESKDENIIDAEIVDEEVKEDKVDLNDFNIEDGKVTMQNRTVKPVIKIKTTKEPKVKIKVGKHNHEHHDHKVDDEEHHQLMHTIEHLNNYLPGASINPYKTETGLLEVVVTNPLHQQIVLSVDFKGLLYNDNLKFFIGHINPGDEYKAQCFMMTPKALQAINEGKPVPANCLIPESVFVLNKILDVSSLREKDFKKRSKILEKAAKALSNQKISDAIIRAANGEPFRFAFARCKNENTFSLVSSKRNKLSNLNPNSNIKTDKEIWVDVKNNEVTMNVKAA